MKHGMTCLGTLLLTAVFLTASLVHAETPKDTLDRLVSTLRNDPHDHALREKIIKHVQAMEPIPPVPEEAERHIARGTAAIKNARNSDDYRDAVNEFEKATLAAPWLASAYYNLGIAADKAGMYAEAIGSLKLYLLASPDAPDAKAVKNFIYEIEYRQEKAARESSPQAMAEKKQKAFEALLGKLDGRRYTFDYGSGLNYLGAIDIRGRNFVRGTVPRNAPRAYLDRDNDECANIAIQGRESRCSYMHKKVGQVECTYVLNEDGDSISYRVRYQDGGRSIGNENIHLWQR